MSNVRNALVVAILASLPILGGCSAPPAPLNTTATRQLVCWKEPTTKVSDKAYFKNIWALPVVTNIGVDGRKRWTLVNDSIVCEEEE